MRNMRWRRLLLWCLAALVLAACFAAYLRPDFMFDMATRIVMCF
ncbi:hypothetical protein [Pseudoduganella lutea]|nr:hypothetical protein [Pseudoduganella lutea]